MLDEQSFRCQAGLTNTRCWSEDPDQHLVLVSHVNRGFIALMSAIIISAALMVAALSGSLAGFYHRDNVLDSQLKERSAALADACASVALLQLSGNPNWQGNATTSVDGDFCHVGPVMLGGAHATFQTRGIYQQAYTTLQITFDTQGSAILSWQEMPTSSF